MCNKVQTSRTLKSHDKVNVNINANIYIKNASEVHRTQHAQSWKLRQDECR